MKLYVDVDTQMDFVFPAGSLYVPGAEGILARVGELNREAVASGAKLISTMDAHTEDDPEFAVWPHHCVKETMGARKPEITQVAGAEVLEKVSVDCFTNPLMEEWVRQWGVKEALVYGVVTEICVQHAALGLLARGVRVSVASNAVRSLDAQKASFFYQEVRARGGAII